MFLWYDDLNLVFFHSLSYQLSDSSKHEISKLSLQYFYFVLKSKLLMLICIYIELA